MKRINIRLSFLLLMLASICFGAKAQLENTRLVITDGIENEKVKLSIQENVSTLLTNCNEAVMKGKAPGIGKVEITSDGKSVLSAIWKSSSMSCPVSLLERPCIVRPNNGGYQVRNIPITMHDAPESNQDQEIVINLTADGKIDDIFIPIHQYNDILSKNVSVEDFGRRQVIIDFVEKFRTSYNQKDLGYLKKVFSNDALIITGKVIKQVPKTDQTLQSLGREKVVYQTSTKEEYMTRLAGTFKRNKYINVLFSDVKVIQHPMKKDIYGVTVKQDWNSTTYSDVGYVFLLIDFKDEFNPMIVVRTWQPDQYNGQKLSREEIFSIGSFDQIIRDTF